MTASTMVAGGEKALSRNWVDAETRTTHAQEGFDASVRVNSSQDDFEATVY